MGKNYESLSFRCFGRKARTAFLTLLMLSITYVGLNAQIPGESCSDPLVVTSLPFNDAGNTSTYGSNYTSSDVPSVAPGAVTDGSGSTSYISGDEVVYAYTPSANGIINISTTNDDDWIGLWVFTGCPFTSTVGYHTAIDGATRSVPGLPVSAGTTYYIVVSTWPSPQSTDYTILIEEDVFDCLDLEANFGSSCTTAENLPGEVDLDCECVELNCQNNSKYPSSAVEASHVLTTISTVNYLSEYSEVSGIVTGEDYEFTVTNGGYITVRSGSAGGAVIGKGYSPLTVTATSDDNLFVHWNANDECGTSSTSSTTTVQCVSCPKDCPILDANIGEVCLDGDGFSGVVNADCDCEVVFGKNCGAPLIVTGLPYDDSGTTADYGSVYTSSSMPPLAPDAIGNPSSSYLGGDEVVYAYTPTSNGFIDISVDNHGSYAGLFVFTGCEFSSTVGGHTNSSATTLLEVNALPVLANETYYIVISTWAAPQSTTYALHIEETVFDCPLLNANIGDLCDSGDPNFVGETIQADCECGGGIPIAENDEACTATELECGDEISQSLMGATSSYEDDCFGSGSTDVWFVFTSDGSNIMTVAETTDFDAIVQLFKGDDCGNLVEAGACKDSPENYTVTEAGTYYFRVRPYFSSADEGDITVSLTCEEYDCTDLSLNFGDACITDNQLDGVLDENCDCVIPPCEFDITSSIEPITRVIFADIDNSSATSSSDALEDFTSVVGNVEQGEEYDIALEGNTSGPYTNYFTVWIDWNQNGVYETSEMYEIGSIQSSNGGDNIQATGEITVPLGAELGTTSMRVIKNYNTSPTNPCGLYSFGQGEDYTIIVAAASVTYDCNDLEANIGDACEDDDNNAGIVSADCECEVSVTYDCNDLEANIGDACEDDDNNAGIVNGDCECEVAGSGSGDECEWTVRVWEYDEFGDEVSWTLKDADDNTILSGGGYGFDYDDTQTVTAEGPLTFYISAIGSWDDNEPNYEVSNGSGVIIVGQLSGGDDATYSDLECDDEGLEVCDGTPDGGVAAVAVDEGVSGSSANFTVTGYSEGLGLTGEWEYSTDGGVTWESTGTSSDDVNFTITGNIGTVFMVRYAVYCDGSEEYGYSNTVEFTVIPECPDLGGNVGDQCVPAGGGYGEIDEDCECVPTACDPTASTVEAITRVVFADIDNASSVSSSLGYEDFTSVVGNVEQGETYEIALEGNTNGDWTNFFTVWIDWNQDGIYENDEMYEVGSITDSDGTDNQQATMNITVPSDAVLGMTTMRVVKSFGSSPTNPCGEYSWGQVEEYSINVSEVETTDPEFDCEDLEANIGDVCTDGNGDEGAINEDCECEVETTDPEFDCEDLEANIGDVCTDENGDEGAINEDCECEVETTDPEFDCEDLEANIGDDCTDENGDEGEINEECECEVETTGPEFDCEDLEANIGDDCIDEDGDEGEINEDCECEVEGGVSIEVQGLTDISVYPNPATEFVNIVNPSNISGLKVEVLDMNGRVVLVDNNALDNVSNATLDISSFERGVYTLRVYNNDGHKIFKIVKH